MTETRQNMQEKDQVREVYQALAGQYDERIPGSTPIDEGFMQTEMDFVLGRVASGDDVLDIGCGTGRFTVPVAARVHSTTALDISSTMLEQARETAAEKGVAVDFVVGDMASLPFDNESFDVVISMLALMHVPREDRQSVFSEVARVLRPGGRMLIGVKNAIFERISSADRFASVDVTDVENEELIFTETSGSDAEYSAPWHSFSPTELNRLLAVAGLAVVELRGNSPISGWIADALLRESTFFEAVRTLERTLGDIPPFNALGYHLLVEAIKPA